MHVRVIVTETGANVEVERVIHGRNLHAVEQRAREEIRQIIEQVCRDNPHALCEDMTEAVHRGYWWADLGSEEFTVMVMEPLQIEQVDPLVVEIDVNGGLISDVNASVGAQVVVRDYDTDGADRSRLHRDGKGRACRVSTLEGDPPSHSDPLEKLHAHLHADGFVILTQNTDNEPASRFEAWAYVGPLDFVAASPLQFGLGADLIEALFALNDQLSSFFD